MTRPYGSIVDRHFAFAWVALLALSGCGDDPGQDSVRVQLACTNADDEGTVGGALSVTTPDGEPVMLDEEAVELVIETRGPGGSWQSATDVALDFNGPSQLDVVLVADNSGSEAETLEIMRESLRDFARQLNTRAHRDRVGLVRVSTEARELSPLTEDLDAFGASLDSLFVTNGWTALWDGLRLANEVLAAGALGAVKGPQAEVCMGRTYRAVVGFTDGRDNNSADQHVTRYAGDGIDTTVADLRQMDVLGIQTPLHLVGVGPKVDAGELTSLAESTRGHYVGIDKFRSLHGKLMSAAARLEGQLPVCFVPADCSDTEARLDVTVTLDNQVTTTTLELPLPSGWCTSSSGKKK